MAKKQRTLLSEDELKIATKSSYVTSDEEAFKLFFDDCKLRNLRPHTMKYYREQFQAIKMNLVTMTEKPQPLQLANLLYGIIHNRLFF